jgi:diamine N-acetyltransferase
LLTTLADFALFRQLGERDVPLGFPVRVPLRDHVQMELFQVRIFPAIHWNLHGTVPVEFRDAHSLSRDILTLPSDHRYDTNDMARLASAFRQAALSAIKLRRLENGDLERLHRWHNDRDLYRYLIGDFFGPTLEQTRNWLQKRIQPDSSQLGLAICMGQTSEHVGNVYFRNIDHENKQAEIHILIGEPNYRDRGVGTATMRTALEYACKMLKLVRVYLYVLEDNARAVSLYERVGFKRQEQLRDHVVKEGVARNVLLMSTDLGSRSSSGADR